MIASRPVQQEPQDALFPEVPSHLPVLHYNAPPPAENTAASGTALPPIPPVQIPTDAARQLSPQEQRNSSPSTAVSAAASAASVASASSRPASMPRQPAAAPAPAPSVQTPPPDYSILYSQPSGAQPKVEPAAQVIEAYPVLPEEQQFSYLSAVQAQPYRGGPATAATATTTSTTTSSNTAAAAAPAPSIVASSTATSRRSLGENEERKEYQPAPPVSLTQQLRNFMHEVGDVIMEVTDEMAARSPTSGTSNAEHGGGPGQIARRQLMPHRVYANPTGRFDVYVTMYQPQLQGAWSTPQGSRPRELLITTYSNEREAEIAGLAHAPPRWDGPNERNTCTICNKLFTFMRRPHHCRNCGHYVCSTCSHKQWPSTMIPATYHCKENKVRTCNGCHFLMETFRDALKHGDYELARQTYESGNVNLHCPNDLDRGEYPVHYAAQGGNLAIMRWLVEEQMCALRDPLVPLLTADKLSVLAVAAMYGQVAIMHYLMHQHGCKITEITDVAILQRALHIIVEAPGDAPPLPRGRTANKKRRGSTRRIASIGNADFSSGAASAAQT